MPSTYNETVTLAGTSHISFTQTFPPFVPYWFSGLESGDISEMPITVGAPTVTSARQHAGQYCLQCNAGDQAGVNVTLLSFPPISVVCKSFRGYFWVDVLPDADTTIWIHNDTNGSTSFKLVLTPDGKVAAYHGDSTLVGTSTPAIHVGFWNQLEDMINYGSATDGGIKVRLNGATVVNDLTLNTVATPVPEQWLFGPVDGTGFPMYFDDLMAGITNWAGPGQCLARQAGPNTPTYDFFNKVGKPLISQVWAQTPYDQEFYAEYPGYPEASIPVNQTMFVAPFNKTTTSKGQSSHGKETIKTGDTVNAAMIGAVGYWQDRAMATITFMTRFAGVDVALPIYFTNQTAGGVGHSPGWFATTAIPAVAVPAVINSGLLEVGVQSSVEGWFPDPGDFKVFDVWLMVDYTPEPILVLKSHARFHPIAHVTPAAAPAEEPALIITTEVLA